MLPLLIDFNIVITGDSNHATWLKATNPPAPLALSPIKCQDQRVCLLLD